ncbi:MAG: hypothetical protein JSS87_10320 [Acidobacteria bacterium]|nr:hypothetical protein [Acidobacteriota bacterium]
MSAATHFTAPLQSSPAMFTDEQVKCIANTDSQTIAAWVRSAAGQRHIMYTPSILRKFAEAASRLSDADVELDEIEHLLIALRRAHVLTQRQRTMLQAAYLQR